MNIYTIGIGSDIRTLERIYGKNKIPTGVALNERVLAGIAEVSNGRYFRATNLVALEQIYLELDKLEPVEYEYQSYQPRTELYSLPLATGLLVMLIFLLTSLRRGQTEMRR